MARSCDGIDDQVNFGSDAATDQLAAFTAMALVYLGSTISAEQCVLTKFTSSYLGKMQLFFAGSGNNVLGCYMNRNGGNDCYAFSNANAISNTTWSVIVSTWAGSGAAPKLYACALGGTLAELSYGSTNIGSGSFWDDSPASLRLGTRDAGDSWFAHTLADFGYWNRVLNSTELADLGLGNSPEFIPSGLVKSSRITGSASPEIDFVGGTNGTVTGTTLVTHPSVIYPGGGSDPEGGVIGGKLFHGLLTGGVLVR